jgi:hypothetical protein
LRSSSWFGEAGAAFYLYQYKRISADNDVIDACVGVAGACIARMWITASIILLLSFFFLSLLYFVYLF